MRLPCALSNACLTHDTAWSIVYSAVFPALVLLLWAVVARPSAHKLHVSFLGLAVSLITTPFLTDIIKNAVGRPRPDLIDRCKPEAGTPGHKLVTFSVCTQANEHILQEGWRSFPSGHSSFAFAGLGFLSLYACAPLSAIDCTDLRRFLAGQLHVFRPRADLGRCLFAFVPTLGALMIAISRCEDYRHDVWDVTAGAFLGSSVAYFTYRRYYPSLRDVRCHVPYDLDVKGDGFAKLVDDEERLYHADGARGSDQESLPMHVDVPRN